jgi:hypothetical protein
MMDFTKYYFKTSLCQLSQYSINRPVVEPEKKNFQFTRIKI